MEQLRQKQYSRSLYRQLGRYGVTVYEGQFQALDRSGAVEILDDGSAILLNTECYRQDTGLSEQTADLDRWIL